MMKRVGLDGETLGKTITVYAACNAIRRKR